MVAYRYPDEYDSPSYIDEDYDGPVDSVIISSDEVAPILETMLDGMNYESPAYTYYKTGVLPDIYGMAGCHTPRFVLVFRDTSEQISNRYSVCFECNNVYLSNGVKYPLHDSYGLSEEGREAFENLQERLFRE